MSEQVPSTADWTRAIVRAVVARRWPNGSAWIDGVGQVQADEMRSAARVYHAQLRTGMPHFHALHAAAEVLTPGWRAFVNGEARHRAIEDARRVIAVVAEHVDGAEERAA